MKTSFKGAGVTLLAVVCAGFLAVPAAVGQNLKVGVVDMHKCLQTYWKTKVEVAKIEGMRDEIREEMDELNATYQRLQGQMADLDKRARAEELAIAKREEAFKQLQEVAREAQSLQRQIQEKVRKSSEDYGTARQQVEKALVETVMELVQKMATEMGYDVIHDKSFLPRANKAIVFVSDKVPDMTETVIAELNKDAPADVGAGGATTGEGQ